MLAPTNQISEAFPRRGRLALPPRPPRGVAARSGVPSAAAALLTALLAVGPRPSASQEASGSSLPELVTPATEKVIEKGLRYLAENQESEGSWDAASQYRPHFYRVAATGLAGLAFLAHGDTTTRGPYAEVVRKAADYLISASTPIGLIAGGSGNLDPNPDRDDERTMYGHAFAMTFLAQVFGQEPDAARREKMRHVLLGAIRLTRDSQTDLGGWAYFPNYYYDEGTLTVTQLQALRACRDAGLVVSKDMIDKGVGFIEASSTPSGGVRYRVQDSRIRPGVTCAAVVALWNAGQYDTPLIRRTMDYVNARVATHWHSTHHAEYVEYYLAQAKWIMGGDRWKSYYTKSSAFFRQIQDTDGHWEGKDTDEYGTTFGTAVALIILQLPYNRLPVYQR